MYSKPCTRYPAQREPGNVPELAGGSSVPKYYGVIIAIVSVVVTALVIGWMNNLDYWRRVQNINSEITRPTVATSHEFSPR